VFASVADDLSVTLTGIATRRHPRAMLAEPHGSSYSGVSEIREPEDVAVSAGTGAVFTILSTPSEDRETGLAGAMFGAVLREILIGAPELPESAPIAVAVALRGYVPGLNMLSEAERQLLAEWLDRAIDDR
jgi:hypothetical protein